jgi:hypothetical protein
MAGGDLGVGLDTELETDVAPHTVEWDVGIWRNKHERFTKNGRSGSA